MIDALVYMLGNLGLTILNVLPVSPFKDIVFGDWAAEEYLRYLNWVFPFQDCLRDFSLFLVAYGIYAFGGKLVIARMLVGGITLDM